MWKNGVTVFLDGMLGKMTRMPCADVLLGGTLGRASSAAALLHLMISEAPEEYRLSALESGEC